MPIAVSSDKAVDGLLLEEEVDADIAAFEKFMMTRVDTSGPLSKPEKAIIKTYLYWKTHPELNNG